jgi:hypothetical protein
MATGVVVIQLISRVAKINHTIREDHPQVHLLDLTSRGVTDCAVGDEIAVPIHALLGVCACRTSLEGEISSWGYYVCGLRGRAPFHQPYLDARPS